MLNPDLERSLGRDAWTQVLKKTAWETWIHVNPVAQSNMTQVILVSNTTDLCTSSLDTMGTTGAAAVMGSSAGSPWHLWDGHWVDFLNGPAHGTMWNNPFWRNWGHFLIDTFSFFFYWETTFRVLSEKFFLKKRCRKKTCFFNSHWFPVKKDTFWGTPHFETRPFAVLSQEWLSPLQLPTAEVVRKPSDWTFSKCHPFSSNQKVA